MPASNQQYTEDEDQHIEDSFGDIDSIRLFTDSTGITSASELTDFDAVEADFSGYERKSVSNPQVSLNDDADGFVKDWGEVVFSHDGGATSNNVVGWYAVGDVWDDSTNTEVTGVMFYEVYTNSITMEDSNDQIRVKIQQQGQGT